MCKLGKHTQCWSALKNRLSPIAKGMKKDTKQKSEQQATCRKGLVFEICKEGKKKKFAKK